MMTHRPPRILQPKNGNGSRGVFYCVHGMTADSRELEPLAQFLAEQGFTVYLSTLIGHEAVGSSDAARRLGSVSLLSWTQQVEWELGNVIASTKVPVFLLGMSFGGLLAMHATPNCSEELSGVVLLSVPVKFRFALWEKALSLFSFLPDFLLKYLGTIPKGPDDIKREFERFRLDSYSIGAAVRLFKLRKIVLANKWPEKLPTIILHAPDDKIVDPTAPMILKKELRLKDDSLFSFPGGSHELAIGPCYREVRQLICQWALGLTSKE